MLPHCQVLTESFRYIVFSKCSLTGTHVSDISRDARRSVLYFASVSSKKVAATAVNDRVLSCSKAVRPAFTYRYLSLSRCSTVPSIVRFRLLKERYCNVQFMTQSCPAQNTVRTAFTYRYLSLSRCSTIPSIVRFRLLIESDCNVQFMTLLKMPFDRRSRIDICHCRDARQSFL